MTADSRKVENISSLAIISFVIGVIASWPVTSLELRQFSLVIRVLSLGFCACCLILLLMRHRIPIILTRALTLFYGLFFYGLFLSVIYDGWDVTIVDVPITMAIVSAGLIAVSYRNQPLRSRESVIILTFTLLVLAINLVTGGIALEIPPRYIFTYQADNLGIIISYSQGITKFFGIATILAIYLLSIEKILWRKYLLVGIALICLILSFIGGARGDIIGLLLTLFLAYFPKSPVKVILSALVFFSLGALILHIIPNEDIVFYSRMQSVLSGVDNIRETLYAEAWNLLVDNTNCFFFGCGFNFYQTSLGYGQGLYPHNFLLEFALVWGVPIAATLVILFLIGIFSHFKQNNQFDGFFLIVCYLTFVFLKSGTVVTGGLFLVGFFYYASRGLLTLKRTNLTSS